MNAPGNAVENSLAGPGGPGVALSLNGADLLADPAGALIWPERRALFVADLHLEKGSAFAARGRLLPPYDTAATLTALATVIERHAIERVFCLGDSFHDEGAGARLAAVDHTRLTALTARCDWTWIAGNHDPSPAGPWGGRVETAVTLGPLVLCHEAEAGRVAGEVSGHYHPKAAVRVRNRRLSRRCFVTDGRRLILPAFGAYTGGLSVLDPAIGGHFPNGFQALLIGREGLYRYPKTALVP